MLVGKVAHNLCATHWLFYPSSCRIRADDNSSTSAVTGGREGFSLNNIYFMKFQYTIIQIYIYLQCSMGFIQGFIDGTVVAIILCFHVLITHGILLNFGYVDDISALMLTTV